MPDDRALVMRRVGAALSSLRSREPLPVHPEDGTGASSVCASAARANPVAAFVTQLASVGGRAFEAPAPLAEWLTARGFLRGYCDREALGALAGAFAPPLSLDTRFMADRIDEYDFGITRAAGAIAETGTIILNDALTSRRLGSLAPWVHVAVLKRSDIVPTVSDAIRALGTDPYVVWCTGPSKTADVEGILIQGVHGPGEQLVLLT
ncbi:MAG TPA: lactate utilization protein [Polyangiaceae bacterium]|nr:lactate utilization protein [Polyangiaceae bacterium]